MSIQNWCQWHTLDIFMQVITYFTYTVCCSFSDEISHLAVNLFEKYVNIFFQNDYVCMFFRTALIYSKNCTNRGCLNVSMSLKRCWNFIICSHNENFWDNNFRLWETQRHEEEVIFSSLLFTFTRKFVTFRMTLHPSQNDKHTDIFVHPNSIFDRTT